MERHTIHIHNETEMINLGSMIAKTLDSNDLVAIVGDLGAGKTHLTKGILAGLGYQGDVTSPTFSLVNEYQCSNQRLCHFDFYRIENANELRTIGWDEYVEEDGIVVVEWANLFPELIPATSKVIKIVHDGDNREVSLSFSLK